MIEDLIEHIRSDETGLQVAMAKAAINSVAMTACVFAREFPQWLEVRWPSESS
jgi:hypothetical protein